MSVVVVAAAEVMFSAGDLFCSIVRPSFRSTSIVWLDGDQKEEKKGGD